MNKKAIILNQTIGNIHKSLFLKNARDNASEPYFYLQNEFRKLNYDFTGIADQKLDDVACVIFWDCASFGGTDILRRTIRYIKQLRLNANTRNLISEVMEKKHILKVLVLFEPPSVDFGNTKKENHNIFDLVFTWNSTLIDHKKYFPIVLPSPIEFKNVNLTVPFNEKKLLVDISSYKYTYHPRSLAKFRIDEIRFFQSYHPTNFDLYGEGWNPSLQEFVKRKLRDWRLPREFFPAYRGLIVHKWDLFPKYKFSLCYENMADESGFISVKVFDCLRAGCVPIYRGACDIENYIDPKAFIDRRKFADTAQLADFLLSMTESEYMEYVNAGKEYLNSPKFRNFQSDSFANYFIKVIHPLLLQK